MAILHAALVAFFALGWALPWRPAWWIVLVGGIVLMVIWREYANNCPLTVLETRLRGDTTGASSARTKAKGKTKTRANADAVPPRFIAGLLDKFLRIKISNATADALAYMGLIASMIICVLRLSA